ESLAEFSSQSVCTLQILRVRGLQSLGDLSRFPSLRHLRIEDQLQLKLLDLTGTRLYRLWLSNCKNLGTVIGLNRQDEMREFIASQVALDLDEFRDFSWPSTMEVVSG